jgi:hypothetical protein
MNELEKQIFDYIILHPYSTCVDLAIEFGAGTDIIYYYPCLVIAWGMSTDLCKAVDSLIKAGEIYPMKCELTKFPIKLSNIVVTDRLRSYKNDHWYPCAFVKYDVAVRYFLKNLKSSRHTMRNMIDEIALKRKAAHDSHL